MHNFHCIPIKNQNQEFDEILKFTSLYFALT